MNCIQKIKFYSEYVNWLLHNHNHHFITKINLQLLSVVVRYVSIYKFTSGFNKIVEKSIKTLTINNRYEGFAVVNHFNFVYIKQVHVKYNTLFKNFKNIFIKNPCNAFKFSNLCFNVFNSNYNIFVYTDRSINYEYSLFFYYSFGVYYYSKYFSLFSNSKKDKFKWKISFSKMAIQLRLAAVVVIVDNVPLDLISFFKSCSLVLLVHCTTAFYYPGVDFFLYVDNITFESKFILLYFIYSMHNLKLINQNLNFYKKYLILKKKTYKLIK